MSNYSEQFGEPFQRHLLAVAARVPGFVTRFRTALSHEYFSSDTNRTLSQVLFDYIDEYGGTPTLATFVERVKAKSAENDAANNAAAVEKLYEDDVSDAASVMDMAVEFGKHQALVSGILIAAESINKGDFAQIRSKIDDAMMVGTDLKSVGTSWDDDDLQDRLDMYLDPQPKLQGLIRTGNAHLDYLLGGGVGRGELGVVLGPPKRGKTTMLVNIGHGALVDVGGLNVVHYSLEIDEKKKTGYRISQRYDARMMGTAWAKKRTTDPKGYTDALKKRIQQYVKGGLFIQSYPTRTASVSNIRSHLSVLAARDFKPDVIIVDYGDIMKPERRLGEARHEQAGIYEDLRALAGEWDAAVWTASQANRASLEKDTVTMADVSESFEKCAIADAVIAFCQTDDERLDGKCRIFTAALRNAEDGRTIECSIRRDACLIKSTQLLDAGMQPIPTPLDDDALTDTVATSKVSKATASAVKKKAGIGKKAARPIQGPGAKKKKAVRKKKKKAPTPEVDL